MPIIPTLLNGFIFLWNEEDKFSVKSSGLKASVASSHRSSVSGKQRIVEDDDDEVEFVGEVASPQTQFNPPGHSTIIGKFSTLSRAKQKIKLPNTYSQR